MKYFTLQDIIELNPYHDKATLRTYMNGRKRISLSGILTSKASDADKVWLTVRFMPIDKAVEFARWCADSVKHLKAGLKFVAEAREAANWSADADSAVEATVCADLAARSAADAEYSAADDYEYGDYSKAYYANEATTAAAWAAARKAQVNKLKELVKT